MNEIDTDRDEIDTDTFDGRQKALRRLFGEPSYYGEDRMGLIFWARQMILHVQDLCAKRAEFGDCETGMGCHDGYSDESPTASVRRKVAADIRAMRFDQ